jgi:hypothetical protein
MHKSKVPVRYDAALGPFVDYLQSLGVDIGSFGARHLTADAPSERRVLMVAFPTLAEADAFAMKVAHAINQRPELVAIADRIGPAASLRLDDDLVVLFWFGVVGDEATIN